MLLYILVNIESEKLAWAIAMARYGYKSPLGSDLRAGDTIMHVMKGATLTIYL